MVCPVSLGNCCKLMVWSTSAGIKCTSTGKGCCHMIFFVLMPMKLSRFVEETAFQLKDRELGLIHYQKYHFPYRLLEKGSLTWCWAICATLQPTTSDQGALSNSKKTKITMYFNTWSQHPLSYTLAKRAARVVVLDNLHMHCFIYSTQQAWSWLYLKGNKSNPNGQDYFFSQLCHYRIDLTDKLWNAVNELGFLLARVATRMTVPTLWCVNFPLLKSAKEKEH